MGLGIDSEFFGGSPIYTLAQSGTASFNQIPIEVAGNGTSIENIDLLYSRAKRKIISQKMILCLVDVAGKKDKPDMVQRYWNTWHCQNRIYSDGSRIYGHYCKNRICTVCLANRKADLINRYYPVLKEWCDPHFLTLTIKTIPAYELPRYTKGMIKEFSKIIEKYRKRYNRGSGLKLIGIRSFECNFNPVSRKYNPHFHVIAPSRKIAELIKMEWLKRIKGGHSNPNAQFIRPVTDMTKDLMEVIKYGSKIFTDPDLKKKSKAKPYVYVSALDNILTAMSGHRLFQSFGFNLPSTSSNLNTKFLKQYDTWKYEPAIADWMNIETGELLTGYDLDPELKDILENNLDYVSQ